MKRSNTRKSYISIPFTLFFPLVFVLFASCHRNKDCNLTITVQNGTSNAPVLGATVHVYPPKGNLTIQDQTATTDASGVARFVFKLPAILSADVTPPTPLVVPPTTLVKLEEGKSVSKVILVY